MILVNGADGIGTGWSTSIPNFNPRDLIANIYRKLDGEAMEKMHPHYFGFQGTIQEDRGKSGSYIASGEIERVDETTLKISELPIKTWTQDYKIFIEKLMTGDEKKNIDAEIKDFKENHTDTTVSFTITASKEIIDKFEREKEGLHGKFKLRTRVNTTNMNVFDKRGRIVKYTTPEALLESFYSERLHYYELRKDHLLQLLRREQRILSNKARFVDEVCSGDLIVTSRKRKEMLHDLKARNYDLFPKQANKMQPQEEVTEDEDEQSDNSSDAELAKGYEYLLGMKIWSLTYEKAKRLREELAAKTEEVTDLEATTHKQLWKNDLKELEDGLDERDATYAAAADEEMKAQGKNSKRQATKKKKAQTKRKPTKKVADSDEEFEVTKKKKKPAKKAVTTKPKRKAKDDIVEIDLDSDGSGSKGGSKSKKSKKPAGKKANEPVKVVKVPAASKSVSSFEMDSDSETEESLSLYDRISKKSAAAPVAARKSGKKRSSPRSARSDDVEEDLESFDASSYEPAALTPAPKRKKTTKKISKKAIEIDDSDDDIFDEHNDSSDGEDVAAPQPRSRSTRGRKPIKYTIDESDDGASDDDDEFNFND